MSNLATYEVILLRLRKVLYCTVSGGDTEVNFFNNKKKLCLSGELILPKIAEKIYTGL
jgi:hypothetical protein